MDKATAPAADFPIKEVIVIPNYNSQLQIAITFRGEIPKRK